MNIRSFNFLNFFALSFVLVLMSSVQTVIWPILLSSLPAPHFWLLQFMYILLYRESKESILTLYFFSFILLAFTGLPIGLLFSMIFILSLIIIFIRNRIFWPGPRYFLLAVLMGILTVELLQIILSFTFEVNPTSVDFARRIGEIFFSCLFAIPMFWILHWIDNVTKKSDEFNIEGNRAES